jgi:hypothetical protein
MLIPSSFTVEKIFARWSGVTFVGMFYVTCALTRRSTTCTIYRGLATACGEKRFGAPTNTLLSFTTRSILQKASFWDKLYGCPFLFRGTVVNRSLIHDYYPSGGQRVLLANGASGSNRLFLLVIDTVAVLEQYKVLASAPTRIRS